MTDKLPNASCAYVEEKRITTYLLDLNHRDGKSKAKFFRNRGFAPRSMASHGTGADQSGRGQLRYPRNS